MYLPGVRHALPLLLALWLLPGLARAQPYPPITDRGYAIDLYQGSVLGSTRIIGMGGASVALAQGASALSANPAAAAVRAPTSRGHWDGDFGLDWLTPSLGSDHDNNGLATTTTGALVMTVGAVGQYKQWGLGLSADVQQYTVEVEGGARAQPSLAVGHLALARSFLGEVLTVGLGLRIGSFTLDQLPASGKSQRLFGLQGAALEAGVIVRPHGRSLRVGASLALPASGAQVTDETCDPMDCAGYILPERVEVPWQVAAGVAWRLGPSAWNQAIAGDFRDERALLLAADVVLTGAVSDGHGLEAFVAKELQPSGTTPSLSVRAGAELEWLPGRLRVRAGSYYAPGRFPGVPGRVHGTLGVELRVWSFHLWGAQRRVRLSVTGDLALHYGNLGASIGFWH